jgi:hypothetical protein
MRGKQRGGLCVCDRVWDAGLTNFLYGSAAT